MDNAHDELAMRKISNSSFTLRTLGWLLIIAIGLYFTLSPSTVLATLGIVVLGLGIAHGVELSHQALHNTGFSSPLMNEFFGVIMGLPLLVSFYEYKISHLAHHAKVGTSEDTEYFDYGDGKLTLYNLLLALTMWSHYRKFFKNFFRFMTLKNIQPFQIKHQFRIKRFYIFVILMIAIFYLIGNIFFENPWKILQIWIMSMIFVAGPIHALIEFPEHYNCQTDTKDCTHNTRTILTNPTISWFVNYNNYHVEHHMFPNVPLQNAKKVYNRLQGSHKYVSDGYVKFYKKVVSEIYE